MRRRLALLALVCACERSGATPTTTDSAPPDAKALEVLARSCDVGDAAVCNTLAAMYLLGKDAPVDLAKSRELQRRAMDLRLAACTKGDRAACAELPYVRFDPPTASKQPAPEPGGEEITVTTLSIVITVDGDLILDGRVVAESEMNAELARACREPEIQAIVASDPVVQYGKVIRMLDLLRENGCRKWAFAVEKKFVAPSHPPDG